MAATPQYGTMVFKGVETGKTYVVDIYVSDVNAALINFDGGAGAGSSSPTYKRFPEDVILVDYSQVTGTADTEKIRVVVNGAPTQHLLRYGVHLTSLNNRPGLRIGIRAGSELSAIQISD